MSARQELRDRRAKLVRQVTGDGEVFPIPGYDGQLWVRLRYRSPSERAKINDRYLPTDKPEVITRARVAQIVAATVGIYDSPKGKAPLNADGSLSEGVVQVKVGDVPVGFDRHFAQWFGFADELPTDDEGIVDPVDVVMATIPNGHTAEALCKAYEMWLVESGLKVEDQFVGES